jgi:hypothetical protein
VEGAIAVLNVGGMNDNVQQETRRVDQDVPLATLDLERRGFLSRWRRPRFPSPLIKPDKRISRIWLSDWLHRKAHGDDRLRSRRRHRTANSPETWSRENWFVPRPCTLCRLRRKLLVRS